MVVQDLSEILLDLAKEVKKIAETVKKEETLKFLTTHYWMDVITDFKYDKKTGGIGYSSSPAQVARDEIDPFSLHAIHESKIETLPLFSKASEIIAEMKNEKIAQTNFWLSNFTNSIVKKTIAGESDSKLTVSAISFLREIEDVDINWYPNVWLEGIIIPEKEIIVKKDLVLKQPVKEDVQRRTEVYSPFSHYDMFGHHHPSCIMLPHFKAKSQNEVQKKIQRLVLVLQLYRVGSVMAVKTKWESDAIMWLGGGTAYGSRSHVSTYKYSVENSDGPKLKEFFEKIEKLIPDEAIWPGTSEVDYLVIAIQRYQDALLKPEIAESRLSFAIMCLEALYLKENERQELEHRLGQRISKFLKEFKHEPLEIYNKIKRSYEIRSSFVHGSPLSKDQQSEALKLAEDIIGYARLSIVTQLQLKKVMDKDKFLNLIENSLLNEQANEKLTNLIKKNCIVM